MAYTYNKNELYHWGIKGQKWGIRRYQNEDGSLTPEGRKRYGVYNDLFGRARVANKKVAAANRNTLKKNLSALRDISKNGVIKTVKTINKNNRENRDNKNLDAKKYYTKIKNDIGTRKLASSALSNLGLAAATSIITSAAVINIPNTTIKKGASIVGSTLSSVFYGMAAAEAITAVAGEVYGNV